jgi:LmbE family N-acetylglucosaminyl deacetylase
VGSPTLSKKEIAKIRYEEAKEGALRKAGADVVFTHYQDYSNCDHNTVSKITSTGIGFDPEEYVDITEVMEIKKKALKAHKSQYTWLKQFSHIDYAEGPVKGGHGGNTGPL